MWKHVLERQDRRISREAMPVHATGGFDCSVQLVGKGSWVGADGGGVTVYFEPSTGAAGLTVAQNILPRMDALMSYCDSVFGVQGKSGNVIICASPFAQPGSPPPTDGTGGAYHWGCGFGAGQSGGGSDWYEDVAFGNPDLTFGLVMAEVCESYMGLQGRGWNCGGSGGEGLSRFLAEVVTGGPNGAMSPFSSGTSWDGTDWISRDQGTDQDYPSIACSVLYCWWMISKGFTPAQLIQAGEPDETLASNYAALGNGPKSAAFADFKSAVAVVGHANDNPWNAPTPVYPLPGPVPPPPPPPPVPPPPPPTKVFTLTFSRAVPKGGVVAIRPFRAKTAISAGTYGVVPEVPSHEVYEAEVD